MRLAFWRRRRAEPAPFESVVEATRRPTYVMREDGALLMQHATATPTPVNPAPPVIAPDVLAERARVDAMEPRERAAYLAAQREAERQAERDRAEAAQRARDDMYRERQARFHAQAQEAQFAWAHTRDDLRAEHKSLADELVRARAELEGAYNTNDLAGAVELRTRVDVAEELVSRAGNRLEAHLRTQPAITAPLR